MTILDTNVLSEVMRTVPDPKVLDWLILESPSSLFVTSVTEAEMLYGAMLLPAGARRDTLERS